jgi:uncharacterized protein (DUF58 family)
LNAPALALAKLAAVAVPFLVLAWFTRSYPTQRLVTLALVPVALSFGLFLAPNLVWPLAVLDALLVLLVLADFASLPRAGAFSANRESGRVASLKHRHRVTLTLTNHTKGNCRLWVRDGAPHPLKAEPPEFAVVAPPRSRTTLEYVLRPERRGAFTITPVHVKARSFLGIWQRFFDCPCETVIHVYPDMKQLGEYALLARTNRLSLVGVRRTRRVGQDHDFERLRDYTVDDNYKHIDWRATARRRKLTVKDFQAAQSQRIVFLVDCGRMMTNQAAGLSLLDHALNAVLMLSYVALRQNDSVGLVCFSDAIHSYVPPRSGPVQMNRLLHASFDLFPRLVESRYDQAFRHLASLCRKRSLVVLVTNLIDEVNANQVERYLTNLVGRHLPLGVLLRDRRLFEPLEAERPRGEALWTAAAAADIVAWRHQVLHDLAGKGALTLDVFPEQMTAPLVNRYLEIKARHLL